MKTSLFALVGFGSDGVRMTQILQDQGDFIAV
jgi:hypothetical protein